MTAAERMDLLEWYAELGWALLPLVRGDKRPRPDVANGWSGYRLARPDVPAAFADGCNVGVLLGEPSHGLADVDLDCPEALRWAPLVLPATLTFGRKGKPVSHYPCRVTDGAPPTEQLRDVGGGMLLELRSTGAQTMFPPSVHPSGEEVQWTPDPDAELAHITAAELRDRVHDVAVLCLVERHVGLAAAERMWSAGEWPVGIHGPVLARVQSLLGMSPAVVRRDSHHADRAYERARRYLQRLPASVSGFGGHAALWTAAQAMTRGFRLSAAEALAVLREEFNQRCEPAWSEEELVHKIDGAINKSMLPWGYLLDADWPAMRRTP